ncbi:hypothetical protein PV08_02641 [Exophiala spinifera]|uniref:Wax synthase domain-containing protein n=1 Tax=Exophiala spinifera TaxID=91928 RepID=A0A0D2BH92_9EURO|nr:uncharacterized protein PV08_02641 [Exophiala spinifera]KIW18353.1 hypothetical protein PV08_02641 [Exophiala spinifera]
MDPRWFAPPNRPIRPVDSGAAAANGAAMLTLLLPPGPVRSAAGVPAILWIAYDLRRHTTGKIEQDYLNAINVFTCLMRYVDFCVVNVPEREFHRVRPDGGTEPENHVRNMTIRQKLRWGFDLFMTMRGVGWNWRVKNVEEVPVHLTRWQYVFQRLVSMGYCYLLMDVHEYLVEHSQFRTGVVGLDFFSIPLGRQVLLSWSVAVYSGCSMAIGYNLVSAVMVGSGLSSPQSWPFLFGSFAQKGYTLRNIWGSCWHQLHRRWFESANSLLLRMLKLTKGSLSSRYLQLYNAFFLSAVMHHVGSLNNPYSPMAWSQAAFFLMQPVAITCEDLAIHFGRKAGLQKTRKTKALGFAWVGLALSYTLRYAAAAFYAAGLGTARHPLVARIQLTRRIFGQV